MRPERSEAGESAEECEKKKGAGSPRPPSKTFGFYSSLEGATVFARDSRTGSSLADSPDLMAASPLCHRPSRPTHTRGYHRQRGWSLPVTRPGDSFVAGRASTARAVSRDDGRDGNLTTLGRGLNGPMQKGGREWRASPVQSA